MGILVLYGSRSVSLSDAGGSRGGRVMQVPLHSRWLRVIGLPQMTQWAGKVYGRKKSNLYGLGSAGMIKGGWRGAGIVRILLLLNYITILSCQSQSLRSISHIGA